MSLIVQREKISTSLPKSYEGIEAIERSMDGHSYLMVLNHHNAELKVELNGSYRDALSETEVHNQIVLAPYAAHVLLKT
ncbi:Beta-galactosidase BgaA [compost metagenome]